MFLLRNRGISHFPFYYAYFVRDTFQPLHILLLLNLSKYNTDDSNNTDDLNKLKGVLNALSINQIYNRNISPFRSFVKWNYYTL